jgi:hypothetical protein
MTPSTIDNVQSTDEEEGAKKASKTDGAMKNLLQIVIWKTLTSKAHPQNARN